MRVSSSRLESCLGFFTAEHTPSYNHASTTMTTAPPTPTGLKGLGEPMGCLSVAEHGTSNYLQTLRIHVCPVENAEKGVCDIRGTLLGSLREPYYSGTILGIPYFRKPQRIPNHSGFASLDKPTPEPKPNRSETIRIVPTLTDLAGALNTESLQSAIR